MVAFNFNTQNLPDGGDGFDLIPTGWYAGFADETGINPTRDGAGAYIKARFRIQGPTHANRVIFKNFNIRNSNDKAVEIGYRELGQWCHSAGRPAINDTQELHGALVEFYVTTRNDPTGQYEPQNEIKRFRKPGTGALGPTVAATMPVGAAQPQAAYTPPANNPFAAQVPRGAVEQASTFTVNNPFAAPAPQPQAAQPQLAGNPFAAAAMGAGIAAGMAAVVADAPVQQPPAQPWQQPPQQPAAPTAQAAAPWQPPAAVQAAAAATAAAPVQERPAKGGRKKAEEPPAEPVDPVEEANAELAQQQLPPWLQP